MARDIRLGMIIQAVDKASAPLRKIASNIDDISRQTGFRRISRAAGAVGRQLRTAAGEAVIFGRRLATAAIAAGAGLFALTKKFTGAGDEIAKQADRIGVGVEELQELRHAFEIGGVAADQTDRALLRLTRSIGEAGKGSGEVYDAFQFMGVATRDAGGNVRPTVDVLNDLSDAMARQPDQARRVYAAQLLMGRSGALMTNSLREGSAGLREHREEARRLGLITEADARASERFNDNLTRLTGAVRGVFYAIGGDLLPVLEPLVLATRDWILANKTEIVQQIKDGVREFADALQATWTLLKNLTSATGSWLNTILDTVPGLRGLVDRLQSWAEETGYLRVILGGLVVALGSKFLLAVLGLIAPLGQLAWALGSVGVKLALLLGPWGLIAAAAVGAALLIYNKWDWITGKIGGFVDWIKNKTDWISDYLPDWMTDGTLGRIGPGPQGLPPALPGAERVPAEGLPAERVPLFQQGAGGRGTIPTGSAPPDTHVGGKIRVEFQNAPAGTRIREIDSDNPDVPLEVNTGYAMGY